MSFGLKATGLGSMKASIILSAIITANLTESEIQLSKDNYARFLLVKQYLLRQHVHKTGCIWLNRQPKQTMKGQPYSQGLSSFRLLSDVSRGKGFTHWVIECLHLIS